MKRLYYGPQMSLILKKIIGLGAALILVAAWFGSGYLEDSYVYYPQIPNPEKGLTVAYNVKNIVVYITEKQRSFLTLLAWIEVGSAIVVALVCFIHRGDPFKSNDKNPQDG
jgi:hypothetical protein